MNSNTTVFSIAPVRGWSGRGFFVILFERRVLPGVVFNNQRAAQWVADQITALSLNAQSVEILLTNPVHAVNYIKNLCEDFAASTVPADVTQLLELLELIGWSQAKLAKKLQLDPNTVSRWITCRTPVPAFVLEYLSALRGVKELANKLDL